MRKLFFFLMCILISAYSYGQVEVKGQIKTFTKKSIVTKALENSPDFATGDFRISFNLYDYEEDQGGNTKVGVKANLTNVSDDLMQEITDEVYAYLVQSIKDRGYGYQNFDKNSIENAKIIAKKISKGQAKMINGGVSTVLEKNKHVAFVTPTGVDMVVSTNPNGFPITNTTMIDYKDNFYFVSFTSNIRFMNFKKALGSTAKVSGQGELSSFNKLALTVSTPKLGMYNVDNTTISPKEFVDKIDSESTELFAGKLAGWKVMANPEKYKSGVVEMLCASIDSMLNKFDESIEE